MLAMEWITRATASAHHTAKAFCSSIVVLWVVIILRMGLCAAFGMRIRDTLGEEPASTTFADSGRRAILSMIMCCFLTLRMCLKVTAENGRIDIDPFLADCFRPSDDKGSAGADVTALALGFWVPRSISESEASESPQALVGQYSPMVAVVATRRRCAAPSSELLLCPSSSSSSGSRCSQGWLCHFVREAISASRRSYFQNCQNSRTELLAFVSGTSLKQKQVLRLNLALL